MQSVNCIYSMLALIVDLCVSNVSTSKLAKHFFPKGQEMKKNKGIFHNKLLLLITLEAFVTQNLTSYEIHTL